MCTIHVHSSPIRMFTKLHVKLNKELELYVLVTCISQINFLLTDVATQCNLQKITGTLMHAIKHLDSVIRQIYFFFFTIIIHN